MQKHGPVNLFQNILTNFQHEVRTNANDVRIQGRVMEFAEA